MLSEDPSVPGHEGVGWGSCCPDLPMNTHAHPSYRALLASILQPGHPGDVMPHSSPVTVKASCNPGETYDSPSSLGVSGVLPVDI